MQEEEDLDSEVKAKESMSFSCVGGGGVMEGGAAG